MQTPPEVPWSTPPASGLALVTALAEVKLTYGSKADPCEDQCQQGPRDTSGVVKCSLPCSWEDLGLHPDQKHQAFECVASTS